MNGDRTVEVKKRKFPKISLGTVLIYLLIAIGAIIILYPLFWMVVSSMKSYKEIYNDVWGFPEIWHFENYKVAWEKGISGYFMNSVIVTVSTVILVVLIASMAAYGLTRYRSRLVDVFLIVIMAGMMINPQVALIPLYSILRNMGILNTRLALILPYVAFRLPLSILLIRSYFLSIPKEIEESAIIDGCGDFGIYFKIYLPMSKPIVLTAVVLSSYYAWNEFLFGTIFIDSDALKTIPSGLMNFRDALKTDWGVLLSGMVIASVPMIILLILLQKHLVRGLSEGSVKG